MQHFAGTLSWGPLPKGNRLKLGFQIVLPAELEDRTYLEESFSGESFLGESFSGE